MRWLSRDTVRAPYMTLCLSAGEFARVARHARITDAGPWMTDQQSACVHTWESGGKLLCVVCLHPDALVAEPLDGILTLVHEAVHVWQRLCDSIGEDEPSREFEAYSIERIAETLICEFRRRWEAQR